MSHGIYTKYNDRWVYFIIKMEDTNIVVDYQCFKKLRSINMDKWQITIEFENPKGKIRLKWDSHLVEDTISGNSLKRMVCKRNIAYYCHLYYDASGPDLARLFLLKLIKYQPISIISLLDHRSCHWKDDWIIRLSIIRTSPNQVHSYGYPQFQKNEIEKLTCEILIQRFIQPSLSPFLSSILLV